MSQYGMAAALLSQFALQVYAAAMFPRPQSKANHLSRSDCNSRSGGVSMNGRFPEWGASLMRKVDCGRRGAARIHDAWSPCHTLTENSHMG